MREDFLRAFDEEFTLPVVGRLEERGRHGSRLGAADELLRRSPIGAAAVERIEHDVAAAFVIKPFHKLAGRVIENGRVPTGLNLPEHLHDDGRLATSGVADDLEMLVLGAQRNSQHLLALVHSDADSSALDGLVELLGRDQNRPLQPPSILHFLASANVLGDGESDQDYDRDARQKPAAIRIVQRCSRRHRPVA